MKDKIKKVIAFIGFAIIVLAAILSVMDKKTVPIEAMSVLPAIFSICFIFSNNATLKNFGYAFAAVELGTGIVAIDQETTVLFGIGLTLMGVASIVYFIEIIFGFFGFVIKKAKGVCPDCPEDDSFTSVEKYAQMLEEGIITESEFESLKAKIFAVDKKKADSIEDLKKWKKLFDKNVISEEEYSSIKSKILK